MASALSVGGAACETLPDAPVVLAGAVMSRSSGSASSSSKLSEVMASLLAPPEWRPSRAALSVMPWGWWRVALAHAAQLTAQHMSQERRMSHPLGVRRWGEGCAAASVPAARVASSAPQAPRSASASA